MVSKKTIVLIETYSADGWGISDRFSPDNENKFSYWPWTTGNWKQITGPIGPISPENVFSSKSQTHSSRKLVILRKIREPVKRDNQFLEQTKTCQLAAIN